VLPTIRISYNHYDINSNQKSKEEEGGQIANSNTGPNEGRLKRNIKKPSRFSD